VFFYQGSPLGGAVVTKTLLKRGAKTDAPNNLDSQSLRTEQFLKTVLENLGGHLLLHFSFCPCRWCELVIIPGDGGWFAWQD
jgi:hypothetical protein